MDTHGTLKGLATSAIIGAVALAGAGTGTTATAARPAIPAAGDPCSGVSNCRVVTHTDVDGDGRLDQVGWRQISQRSIQLRVETATGKLLSSTVNVRLWWGGGAWGGAAHIDGVPGRELLVGSMQGAHTPMYTMLTYRSGKLVVENSPYPGSRLWLVDAADGDYMGWWRSTSPTGQFEMTQKVAVRDNDGSRFSGHDVTYTWSSHGWVRTSSTATTYASGKRASVIAGWHVPNLKAFPGV